MKTFFKLTYSVMFGMILLPGCTLYEKPVMPPVSHPEHFKVSINKAELPQLNDRWWENFNNPQLNALVEQSLKTNYSYLIAIKNIDIAQTYVDISMTGLFPIMVGDFATSRNKEIVNVGNAVSSAPQLTNESSAPFNLSLISATVNYEIDVWNQAHNQVDQAKSNKYSVESNTNITRLTLISSVVNTYYQIMALTQDINNLKKQLKSAVELLDLTRIQYKSGLIDESNVFIASNQVETIRTTLNINIKQKEILEFGLAYLVGEYPENFSVAPKGKLSDVKFAELIPAGIPSRVIAKRPDVQYNFGQIMAYGYLEKVNIANFLPNFSLSGTFGYASNILSNLITNSNVLWTYGANISQILYDYPSLLAQLKQSKIQYESAVLSYKNTVQNAFVEVDSALTSYQKDALIMKSFSTELDNDKELLSIANAQYTAGLTDYTNYLTNNISELQSAYNLTNQQLVVVQDIVQAYKAMGLGVKPPEPVEKVEKVETATDLQDK